jgi:hypothetical protein
VYFFVLTFFREEKEKRQHDIRRKREEYERIAQDHESDRKTRSECDERYAKVQERADRLKIEEDHKKAQKTSLERSIKAWEGQKTDTIKVFGAQVPMILDLIKKNLTKFHRQPHGPVGKAQFVT